jgi:hypothetical protein
MTTDENQHTRALISANRMNMKLMVIATHKRDEKINQETQQATHPSNTPSRSSAHTYLEMQPQEIRRSRPLQDKEVKDKKCDAMEYDNRVKTRIRNTMDPLYDQIQ